MFVLFGDIKTHATPGYISEENKNTNLKRRTPVFIAAIFTIAKIMKAT